MPSGRNDPAAKEEIDVGKVLTAAGSMSVVKEPLKKDSRSDDGRVSCDAVISVCM